MLYAQFFLNTKYHRPIELILSNKNMIINSGKLFLQLDKA